MLGLSKWLYRESNHMKMANTVASIMLVILFCGSAVGTRTSLLSVKGQGGMSAVAPVASDGICKAMVQSQGYACEEHTVVCLHLLVFLNHL
jgi:hypothetical protein